MQKVMRAVKETDVQEWLINYISNQYGLNADYIDIREVFSRYGIDSIDSVTLSADLGDWIGYPLPSTILWDYSNIESLAKHLATASER